MDFTNYKKEILKIGKKFLNQKLKEKIDLKFYANSLKKIFESTENGKMLRSGLFLETVEILSEKKVTESEYKIALAIEILQTSLLIHDDIMDKSLLRRRKPSIVAQYLKDSKNQELANSLAICNGDVGFFIAWEILSDIPNLNLKILQIFAKEFGLVCIAQMTDVDPSKKSGEEILNLYRYKTARYSFLLPLTLAATLVNQKSEDLEEIGENIGILFQIRDDWLDINGDPEKTGKQSTDIEDQKQTLALKNGAEEANLLSLKIETETLDLIDKRIKHPKLNRLLVEIMYYNKLRES